MANGRMNSRRTSEPDSPLSPTSGANSYSDILASWKKIQTNTFVRWANEHLREAGAEPVGDLAVDFSDGVRLIALIEALSKKPFPRRYSRQPTRRNQRLENVTLVLEYLEREEKIRLVNIDSSDIVDGNIKLILGLMWSLIIHYSISHSTWNDDTNPNAEKKQELTPKQRLLTWIQNKLPEQNISNFTTDWIDGRNIGAMVDSIAPGLCPDWREWNPGNALENARKAMTIAEESLNIPQLITPDEMTDPKLDEQSAMTYLAQFPSARPKSSICIRRSGICAVGPGVVGLPLEFTIGSLDDSDISGATVKIFDPAGHEKEFDVIPVENTKTLSIQFKPETKGVHKMTVDLGDGQKSSEDFLTFDVRGSVNVAGPGLESNGVAPLRKTHFEVHADDMKIKDMEVTIVQPESADKSILHSDICKTPDGQWKVEYTPLVEGIHTVDVLVNGGVINGSPFNVFVSSECTEPISMKGRGVQPSGLRVGDEAVVVLQVNETYAEPKIEATPSIDETNRLSRIEICDLEVSISDPDGAEIHGTSEHEANRLKYTYKPEKVGKFSGAATYRGQNISGSPFVVNVSPAVTRKSRVFGPGLHSGIVGHQACFTVDRHEDESLIGISVDGPQTAEVEIKDNEDGSKDVSYIPMIPGEYAVHVLCNDDEDIPGSPFMVDVTTAPDDFDPTKVLAYGNGLSETGITVDEWTDFTVDTTLAGQAAELCVEAYDDEYNKVEVHMDEGNIPGAVECQYKPQRSGQHRIFVSYGGVNVNGRPFRVQVNDNLASYPVVELPVEAVRTEHISSEMELLDSDDASIEYQALRVKAYGDGLGCGFAGHSSSFIVVMSDCSVECLGVAIDGPCKVEMDCFETKEGYKFSYIPRVAGEFIVSINYAGKFPIPGSPFHVYVKEATNLYCVRVYTGNKLFAGTDANVYITLFGEIGDTGTIHLKASRTHLNKFERNQMDEFFVEAVNIGELKKIKIGHDNAGKVGTSWFLDRVEIESPLLGKHWVFPFRRWLSKGDLSVEMVATVADDTRVVPGFSPVTFSNSQEMKLEEVTKSSATTVSCESTSLGAKPYDAESISNSDDGVVGTYHVHVFTGNKLFAGTDANVYIEIFGEKGVTGIMDLKSSKKNWNKFERNKKDEFLLDVPDVGELIKIRIGHDNSGLFGSSWYLDKVEVESKLLGKRWCFPYRQWLSKEKHGCSLEAELFPKEIINANELPGGDQDFDSTDLADVKASGPGLENQLSVNATTSFLVDVSEAEPGNLLLLSVQGPTEPCPVNMTYEGNGIYNVSYQPREMGEHIISIKWGKRNISGSPFVVTAV